MRAPTKQSELCTESLTAVCLCICGALFLVLVGFFRQRRLFVLAVGMVDGWLLSIARASISIWAAVSDSDTNSVGCLF